MGFLPEKTEFRDNAIAIDPEGCGCTDCQTGQAIHPSQTGLINEALDTQRTLINRTGHEVILPTGFRLDDDAQWPPLAPRFRMRSQIHCDTCDCPTHPSD